jgi:Family of unknown function (DUF5519)/Mycothiol maleylpyruvate isomerase N-terminal domain
MSERAQALAERFEAANDWLKATVEGLTEAQWSARAGTEGWSVGVTAHHLAADHAVLAGVVEAVATGRPLPALTMEMLHRYNAQHAEEHAHCTRAETLELLQREGAAAARMVRGLSDEQLERTAVIPWEGGPPVNARQLIEQKLIGHIQEHLPSIQSVVTDHAGSRELPRRAGGRPSTTPTNPHQQLDQQPTDPALRAELARRVFALPDVEERPSVVSVPGARALSLRAEAPAGPPKAFMSGREFAHLHPGDDQSLHAMLPEELAQAAIAAGWAEPHPLARTGGLPRTAVMLYAPRDHAELGLVYALVLASYRFAGGRDVASATSGRAARRRPRVAPV